MIRRKPFFVFSTGVLALALGVGAFTYRPAFAQAPTPTPTAKTGLTTPGNAAAETSRGERRGGIRDGVSQADLAAALGVDEASLAAAKETAAQAALDLAVSQGVITQEEADAMAERGLERIHFGSEFTDAGIDYNALLAEALGISTTELQAAKEQAFTMQVEAAVAAGALTQEQADWTLGMQALAGNEQFQASITEAYQAAVKQAVSDGIITEAQAEQILANSSGKHFMAPGRLGVEDRPGGRGEDRPAPPAAPDTTTPEDPTTETGL